MSATGERPFLSIGEVLAVLQPEFPDVTISKIRFLESQGLIDPERTASGYRKFYDGDLARLRFILREQKDHFLPLKVIKDRLDAGEAERAVAVSPVAAGPADAGPSAAAGVGEVSWATAGGDGTAPEPAAATGAAPAPAAPAPAASAGGAGVVTLEELAAAAGLTVEQVREIEAYGLVRAQAGPGAARYDAGAVAVARLAAAFLRHGIEPRHLRMYRTAAEREAGLVEQAVLPLLKQRNPRARAEAAAKLEELVELGSRLRECLVRGALRPPDPGR